MPVAYVVVAVAPQTYPNSTGPNVSERDGIILADLHKSLQIWGWFLPKKNRPPHPRGGVEVGILGGQQIKSQNSGKCHELSRKSIKKHPTPGGSGRGGWGSTFKKSGKFHELSRKSIKKSPPPPPPPPTGVAVGILGGQKIKRPGNVMNCPENK